MEKSSTYFKSSNAIRALTVSVKPVSSFEIMSLISVCRIENASYDSLAVQMNSRHSFLLFVPSGRVCTSSKRGHPRVPWCPPVAHCALPTTSRRQTWAEVTSRSFVSALTVDSSARLMAMGSACLPLMRTAASWLTACLCRPAALERSAPSTHTAM